MFSVEFKDRHPRFVHVLTGALVTLALGPLVIYGVLWFVQKMYGWEAHRERYRIIWVMPAQEENPKPGGGK